MTEQVLFKVDEKQFNEYCGEGINAVRLEIDDEGQKYAMLYTEMDGWVGPVKFDHPTAFQIFWTTGNLQNDIALLDLRGLWPKTFQQPISFEDWQHLKAAKKSQ